MFSYASGHGAWEVYGAAKDHSLYLFSVGLHPNLIRINFPKSFLDRNISKQNNLFIIKSFFELVDKEEIDSDVFLLELNRLKRVKLVDRICVCIFSWREHVSMNNQKMILTGTSVLATCDVYKAQRTAPSFCLGHWLTVPRLQWAGLWSSHLANFGSVVCGWKMWKHPSGTWGWSKLWA